MITPAATSRPRGRPPASDAAQRHRLLQAAQELLTATELADLNLRQVALRAGVTPPLAHYYFKNRAGLLAALLEECAAPRIDALIAANHDQAVLPVATLTRLMQRLIQLAATDAFLCRCLLLPAAGSLRERLRTSLGDLLQQAQASGQLRADLPRDYLCNALLGLCLFPLMDSGATQDAARLAASLTLRHAALLQDGILPRAQRS
jgi:TetR/AcrR family transcriptional regulator